MASVFGSLAPQEDDPLVPPPRNPAMPADWAQEAVRKVLGGVANLVMAPRRAMDQGMTTADSTDWAGDVATMGVGAGAPAAVRGAAGIFGGRLAQTADRAALARAEELAKAGAPREQIWNDTGWFKGGDDKWRFEIPDNAAALTGQRVRNQTMQQEMAHPELYAAYPETADIGMLYGSRPGAGSYWKKGPDSLERISVSEAQTPSTHLHELQHAIQAREGFPSGTSTEGMKSLASELFRRAADSQAGERYRELEAKRSAVGGSLTPAEQNEMTKIYKNNFDMYALQRDAYHRNAGEVEARNVQTRMNMTPEERRAKPPWLTEDVPAEQQIFGTLAPGGAQMSIETPKQGIRAYHSSPHDFERFDVSKIGAGQGVQSYGHGLYFAENPAVSGQGGEYWREFAHRFSNQPTPEGMATRALTETKADRAAAIAKLSDPKYQAFLKDFLPQSSFKDVDAREALRLLESDKPVGPRTYEVNINAKPEQFLDWDKPLAEQPSLTDAVRQTGYPGGNIQGQDFYRQLGIHNLMEGKIPPNDRGAQYQSAAQTLREAGIPGIKYLDQGSRGATSPDAIKALQDAIAQREVIEASNPSVGNRIFLEESRSRLRQALNPTSNYVLFDDKLIDILRKYGLAGAAALPAAGGASFGSLAPNEQ